MTEHKPEEHEFFVDAKRFTTDKAALTGIEIKTRAGVTATYQLYLEEDGDTPDRAISDGESVDLRGKVKHFFAVPPATFGLR
jgi:Multiubiquitin